MASSSLTPKTHLRLPVTTTKVATLTPLREEQILTPRELVKPAECPARRAASGASALKNAFADARAEGRAALIPYLTAGYPTKDETVDLLLATQAGGADVIELGVPCGDPFMEQVRRAAGDVGARRPSAYPQIEPQREAGEPRYFRNHLAIRPHL
ncbi:unnamed protein product [Pelagomonas calceolata]|uniref:tryptophan synthase n=1 Tax=Pelagomonas calceolata TaxID=35677 RepID=A0A8J2S8F1_9STRA|nr:unnamed protein product [Pelagomonas calceolata]